jgi:hypothetical protein
MSSSPTPSSPGRSWRDAAAAFVAAPATPRPFAALRLGVAAVLLIQALWIAPDLFDMFGPHGYVQWTVADRFAQVGAPRLSWVADFLAPFEVDADTSVRLVYFAYVGALSLLLIGCATRPAAIVAWLTHLMFKVSGTPATYGVDHFANIGLFYLMWAPAGGAWSVDRWLGRADGQPTAAARLLLRVVQVHLCIVYFSSGYHKATGLDWWTGDVIWDSVMRPDLAMVDLSWLAHAEWITVLVAWGTLILELGYPFYVWSRWTRTPWIVAVLLMHVGIAIFLGLVSFSMLMIVLNAAVFLVSAEPTPVATPTRQSPRAATPPFSPARAVESAEACTLPAGAD